MSESNEKYKRFRLSVPWGDETVLGWCRAQVNLSYSLRMLIKDYVAKNGFADPTCGEPPRKSPGRPPKSAVEDADLDRAEADAEVVSGNAMGAPDLQKEVPVVSAQPAAPVSEDEDEDMGSFFAQRRGQSMGRL